MYKLLLVLLLFSSVGFAQENYKIELTGNLRIDSQTAYHEAVVMNTEDKSKLFDQQKKTPILAGVMSFALPGSGQFYNNELLKSGIFLAVEAAAISVAVIYNGKGDDQTSFFENYANQHWDAARYAKWTFAHVNELNPDLFNDPTRMSYYNQYLYTNAEKTKVNWKVLNELEQEVSSNPGGQYYSHRLAPYADQQYYEMIGKYSQFNIGWDTFGDENTPYTYGDPLVEQFHYYSIERGKANDFYKVAKWGVIAVVSNHIISAFDAAWSAGKYNKKLKMNLSVESDYIGYYREYYPQLNIQFSL